MHSDMLLHDFSGVFKLLGSSLWNMADLDQQVQKLLGAKQQATGCQMIAYALLPWRSQMTQQMQTVGLQYLEHHYNISLSNLRIEHVPGRHQFGGKEKWDGSGRSFIPLLICKHLQLDFAHTEETRWHLVLQALSHDMKTYLLAPSSSYP